MKRRVRLKEVWRPVPGYEGYYEVSSEGNVRRVKPATGTSEGRTLKPSNYLDGRLYVGLCKESKSKKFLISVLVCTAFHGERPSPAHQAAHWDGNLKNNSAANLRWATQKENEDDKKRHGTFYLKGRGSKHGSAKLVEEDIPTIRLLYMNGFSTIDLHKMYGVDNKTIWAIVNKKAWTHV